MGVTAFAETLAAPLVARRSGLGVTWWLRSALSLLVVVAILAVALPAAFGSGVRGAGVDPVQVFSSGSLVSVEAGGEAQLSVAGMVPGQSRSATIRLSNTGSAAAALSLAERFVDRAGPGAVPLSRAINLRVQAVGAARPLYSGSLGRLGRIPVGRIPAGGQRRYRFIVTLPQSVGNEVAGSSLSAGFAWAAV